MNTYTGTFNNKNWYQVFKNGQPFSHERSYKHVTHSPDGFSWGYMGSGPSQLAFAILLEETDDPEFTRKLYYMFKNDIISALPQDSDWKLTSDDVEKWICNEMEEQI